jgi:acyl-CoA thioesterase
VADLEVETRLEGGSGRYRAALSAAWMGPFGLYGGALSALALRAAGAEARIDRPASLACHYLSAARPGPFEIEVSSLRRSSRSASLRVRLTQEARPVLEALVWMAAQGDGLAYDFEPMPPAPEPEGLRNMGELARAEGTSVSALWEWIEARPTAWVPYAERRRGDPSFRWWWRLLGEPALEGPLGDAMRCAAVLDGAFHAPMFNAEGVGPANIPFATPSMDLFVHFHRAAPEREWLLCQSETRVAEAGLVAGDARLWTDDGRLLASARSQLACRPRDAGGG